MNILSKTIVGFVVFALLVGLTGAPASAQTLGERDERAKAEYRAAQDQYQSEVNFYRDARQNYREAKESYRNSPSVQNREALDEAAKAYLEQAVGTLMARLETIKAWVENRKTLSEADKQEIIAEIDEDLTWLQERLSSIQNAASSEIRDEAKEVRDYWDVHRARVKSITGHILAARIDFVIAQAEDYSAEVAERIEAQKALGKDTSELEAWLVDYDEDLALAKEKNELARERFDAIKGEPGFDADQELSEANQLFAEGNEFVREANEHVRDAHALLVQIARELKSPEEK